MPSVIVASERHAARRESTLEDEQLAGQLELKMDEPTVLRK
jgi:hypothetical protein